MTVANACVASTNMQAMIKIAQAGCKPGGHCNDPRAIQARIGSKADSEVTSRKHPKDRRPYEKELANGQTKQRQGGERIGEGDAR